MLFKDAIHKIEELRFLAIGMNFRIPMARKALMDSPFLTEKAAIEQELDRVERMYALLRDDAQETILNRLDHTLERVGYISDSVKRLREGLPADDVDFYELKFFSLVSREVREIIQVLGIDFIAVPDLSEVISILDPDKIGTAHFFIYDSYSDELREARRELRELYRKGEDSGDAYEALAARKEEAEQEAARRIAKRIRPYCEDIEQAYREIIRLDLLLAKGKLAVKYGMAKPEVASEKTIYQGLFNPVVAEELKARHKKFQPVDITFEQGTTLITGANMGGKSVLLRSVALAQVLFQYGFFVPAGQSSVVPVLEILVSKGDGEDGRAGLSSFAGEILRINEILRIVGRGGRYLVLIDEPASATNPKEGRAIVNALVDMLNKTESAALVTTHYDGVRNPLHRIRVKGLRDEGLTEGISVEGIMNLMDYSLVPDEGDAVREALRVSRLLGVDPELTEGAEKYLQD